MMFGIMFKIIFLLVKYNLYLHFIYLHAKHDKIKFKYKLQE